MYEKEKPLMLDTLFANVPDLDAVLSDLYTKLQLRPFLRFELDAPEGITPIALLRLGEHHTLELLGRTEGERPQSGIISDVEIEAPVEETIEIEPVSGMKIRCQPGSTPGIRSVEVLTTMPKEDAAVFIEHTGATMKDPDSPLDLGGVSVQLTTIEGLPSEEAPGLFFPGWHRLSVRVPSVTAAYEMMAASGSSLRSLVLPFQAMPGLREAMLLLPSDLILQITEESLLKMTPSLALEWVKSKFSGHRIRFKTKDM